MVIMKRGIGPVLSLVFLVSACAEQQTNPAPQMVIEATGRLDSLEREMSALAGKRAWSGQYLDGGSLENAWLSGTDLYLESLNPVSRKYEIHAVDARDGTLKWLIDVGSNKVRLAPRAGDRYVVFLTENDGGMVVVNRVTGAREFRLRTELAIATSAPATSSDTSVFVASLATNQIVALSPNDATAGWRYPLGSAINGGPVMTPRLPRRLVVVGCNDGTVTAVPAQGWNEVAPSEPAWKRRLLGSVGGDLAIGETVDGNRHIVSVLVPCRDRGLYCLEAASGDVRWACRTESAFERAPQVLGGGVFGHNADRMVALDLASGRSLWKASDPAAEPSGFELCCCAYAYDKDRTYLGCGDRNVCRVDSRTGEIQIRANLVGFDRLLSGGEANVIIGLTTDGNVVAFR